MISEQMREAVEQALSWAYIKGAEDVYRYWTENPGDAPRGDPKFGAAASNYAKAALDPYSSAARVPNKLLYALHAKAGEDEGVTRDVYEAAVKDRQDFRNSYRALLPIVRAAETICRLWRSPQRPFQVSDEFADAINALDVAVTGGGAKPDWDRLEATSVAVSDEREG